MEKLSINTRIKVLIYFPFLIVHLFLFSISKNKHLIISDIKAWGKYRGYVDSTNVKKSLLFFISITT